MAQRKDAPRKPILSTSKHRKKWYIRKRLAETGSYYSATTGETWRTDPTLGETAVIVGDRAYPNVDAALEQEEMI